MTVDTVPLRRRRVGGIGAIVLITAALWAGSAAGATAASASIPTATAATTCVASPSPAPASGIDMTATVVGPGAPDCSPPVPSSGGTSSGAGGSGGSGRGASTGSASNGAPATDVAPTVSTTSPTGDEVDLGGVLNVGGLSSAPVLSMNPFGGDLQVWFTVRNVSSSTIEATADFWMEGLLGNRISAVDDLVIADLKPGETRTVSAELPGVGQWTVLTAHARLEPPAEVGGTELSPLTRDATVFVLPWLFVLIVAAGLGAWAIAYVLRRRDVGVPMGVPA
ncbi:hypothetical protein [Microbacterium hatanonis]|jgi:hypothetical protein|uniref:hypothetical protein n=1 Tax=Microbacterium hatanonis TaxID=404366 RepID=UPI00165074CE|nr:hypothetical protein [Microbacterium hatanonis]